MTVPVFLDRPFPECDLRFISTRHCPFRVPSMSAAAHRPFGVSSLPGFLPFRGITIARPLGPMFPPGGVCPLLTEHSQRSATFRPQAFSASRRFSPCLGFVGLLHPTATSRTHHCSGTSPRLQPTSLIGRLCPLVVSTPRLTGRNLLPTCGASTSRLCSARQMRSSGLAEAAPLVASLFRFLGSSGPRAAGDDLSLPVIKHS